MAAQRRKWRETLRDGCEVEKNTKKSKIKILQEIVYKEENGKLVKKKISTYSEGISKDGTHKEELFDSNSSFQKKNSTSPNRKAAEEVKNLTPTFRNPKNYLAATAEFLKEISPDSEQINRSFRDKGNNEIQHDTNSQKVSSPIQCASPERFDLIESNKTKCNSPDWATCESYEVEITIERNSGVEVESTQEKPIDTEVNISLEPEVEMTKQSYISRTLDDEIENMEADNTFMTKKIIGIKDQSAIFADTSDEIRPASDPDTAKSEDEIPKKNNLRRSRRKLNFDKSYLDFVDEDSDNLLLNEAFPSEESSLELNATTSSSDSEHNNSKKDKKKKKKLRKKQSKNKSKTNMEIVQQLPLEKSRSKAEIKKENSEKKKKGKSYINTKGETVEGKRMKPNPCAEVRCGNNCGNVSEERRLNIFKHFWGLGSYQRRRDWIAQCAIRRSVKRPTKTAVSNRSQTYEYFINEGEGRRKVCQKFLIATLDVTQRFMLYTLDTMIDGFAKEDGRGKGGGHNKTSEDVLQDARNFILDLPLLPSHYCRRDSTKLYLPEEFKNISNLYRIYQDHCAGKKIMSFKVFSTWFRKTFNIGFHVPKKDKCALCVSSKSFDVKTQEEMEKLQKHENEKEESYKRFIFHQKLNKIDKGTVCASFDLQKVLNTPYGESMTLYYSRKIAVYNYTIYESNTQLGICNLWTEVDAKRGANEIATCLLEYIKNVDKRGNVKQIILYCDSAYGQNKNKTILAMLRYALSITDNVDTIQINYLIPGHTYMPVDSMHATIENSVKNSIVWAPSQWPTIIPFSRKNPEPYTVNVLNGEDFLGFENIVENTFKKNQNLQISRISIVTFRKKQPEKMFVKTSMLPDAEAIEVQLSALSDANPKQKLYNSKLPICQKKYSDLKKLVEKLVIPKRFAKEYLNLKTNTKVKDCLPDTDVEDDC